MRLDAAEALGDRAQRCGFGIPCFDHGIAVAGDVISDRVAKLEETCFRGAEEDCHGECLRGWLVWPGMGIAPVADATLTPNVDRALPDHTAASRPLCLPTWPRSPSIPIPTLGAAAPSGTLRPHGHCLNLTANTMYYETE